ncbi:MAG: glycogen debranching protein GlgX, partial [Gemmatimonadaceae bacterium]
VVIDPRFDWEGDRRPDIPLHESVIYETHVRGFTRLHPDVREDLRGTYAGLASQPAIAYLRSLGVTAVELLPVHHFVTDRHLADKGLTNYWGYNSIGFFAPDVRYARGGLMHQVYEFKSMVKKFHSAGIEVILDVVYNHTGEGNHMGPTLSLRGVDNKAYYRLEADKPRFYTDFTGTGNSLNMLHPRTLQLIMDSLRYWVTEMHVDGFRFDLAPVLARELFEVNRLGTFFDIMQQDPVLSQVKLIAEPWDVGPGGYQVGNFPVGWAEWNGKFRDSVRHVWRGDPGHTAELATRLSGSSDLYQWTQRGAYAGVNFVTAHDGYTLYDLTAYEKKHNEANGENNQDGHNDNISRNWGAEGPTNDDRILDMRFRTMRNFLATLAFSQGVPMISHGDEIARSQKGNNNAYAQDNELTWVDWALDDRRRALLEFTRAAFAVRLASPVLRRRHFFKGGDDEKELVWLSADGKEMTDDQWQDADNHALQMLIHGEATDEHDDRGRPIKGDTLLLLVNAGEGDVKFTVPDAPGGARGVWVAVIDTAHPRGHAVKEHTMTVAPYSLVLLRFGTDRRMTLEVEPLHQKAEAVQ